MLIQGEGRKEERNYPPLPPSWLGQREDMICKTTNFKFNTAVRGPSAFIKWKQVWCFGASLHSRIHFVNPGLIKSYTNHCSLDERRSAVRHGFLGRAYKGSSWPISQSFQLKGFYSLPHPCTDMTAP